jgi:hypothetical protein
MTKIRENAKRAIRFALCDMSCKLQDASHKPPAQTVTELQVKGCKLQDEN